MIGGPTAEAIAVFLYDKYYLYVIALAAIAVFVGWIAMYIGKKEGFSVKKKNQEKSEEDK